MLTSFNHDNCYIINLEDYLSDLDLLNNNQFKQSDQPYKIMLDQNSKTIEIAIYNNSTNLINKPIYIFNHKVINYRLIFTITPNTKVTLIDHKITQNSSTEIRSENNSKVDYYLIQKQDLAIIKVNQYQDSNFNAKLLATAEDRNNLQITVNLLEPLAKTNLQILQHSKLQGKNSIDLLINHLANNTISDTVARIIAEHNSKTTLTGKIKVDKKATDTKANLQSKGLIISKHASIVNRPELIIDHNQIVCSHGVSIGDLDPNAILYMQARGISLELANNILLEAFKQPILKSIQYPEIIENLEL